MDRTRISCAVLVSLALLLLVACESDEAPTPGDGSTSATSSQGSPIAAPAGSFRYEGLDVEAVLTLDGPTGVLEIRNATGVELGEPRLYLFAADDGTRVDILTRDPTPVGPEPMRFVVELGGDAAVPIGMVFLRLGDDDFGAFVPVGKGAAA